MTAQQTLPIPSQVMARPPARAESRSAQQWRLVIAALVAADVLALGAAFGLAYLIRFKMGIPILATPSHSIVFYTSVAFWAVPVWLVIFTLYRLYDRHYLLTGFQEYTRAINGCTAGMMALIVGSFLDESLAISRGWLLIVWVLSILAVGSSRFLIRRLLRRLRRGGFLSVPTIIVGANEEGRELEEQFRGDPGSGTRIVGFIDAGRQPEAGITEGFAVLGGLADLGRVIRDHEVKEIIVATTAVTREELLDLYRALGHDEEVEIRLSSGLFEILTTGIRVQEIGCVPLMTPQKVRITGVDAAMKAALDYAGASLGLLALSPLLAAIALLVRLDSPGPMLHRRRVLGCSGRPFYAYKFRTMMANADELLAADPQLRAAYETGYKLKSDPRVTRAGRFLRRTSLDELPQLLNVLRGEMSLVGPRMIAPEEADLYGRWRINLLTVKPGITGPWQVHGRSDIPYEERVRLSMHYIRNYSIWLDLEILLRTVPAVLRSKGAY